MMLSGVGTSSGEALIAVVVRGFEPAHCPQNRRLGCARGAWRHRGCQSRPITRPSSTSMAIIATTDKKSIEP
ncbi:hypothetical protein ANTRET_LOCUS4917 [Anthophora retusa]